MMRERIRAVIYTDSTLRGALKTLPKISFVITQTDTINIVEVKSSIGVAGTSLKKDKTKETPRRVER
jgi:hypothetical protein